MAYRALLQAGRDISVRSLTGQNYTTSQNISKGHMRPDSCQKARLAFERFQASSAGLKLKSWCHKLNDHLNILAMVFAKQCSAIATQRVRRGAQIINLYSRLYDKQTLKKVVCRHSQRRSLTLLLGAVLFAWDEHKISDSKMREAVEELTNLRKDSESSLKQQLANSLGSEWESVMDRDNLAAWRKPVPGSYLYEYKVYGTFSDIPARAFFNVQTDLEYRKKWDKLVIHLDKIDHQDETGSEVIRWVTHFPFPMYSREYVYIRRYKVDPENKVMVFMSQGTEHPRCPVSNKFVRVYQYKSNMVVRPHGGFDENGFDYVVTYYDDPQAPIPSAAIKWMASTGVPDFVEKLHKAAQALHEMKKRDDNNNDNTNGQMAM